MRKRSSLAIAGAIMAAYTVIAVSRRIVLIPNAEAAIWPAAALLAAGFLLVDRRHWPVLIGIAAVENLILNTVFGFSYRTLLTIPESGLLAYLTHLAVGRELNFCDGRRLGAYLALAVVPTCLASAAGLIVLPTGGAPATTLDGAGRWFLGHALGAAVTLPSVVTLFKARRFACFRRPRWELAAASAVMLVYVVAVLWNEVKFSALFVFPMAMFIAFRHGPVGAATASLSLTVVALVYIYLGAPSGGHTPYTQQWTQLFVAVLSMTVLPAAGALASSARMRSLLAKRTQTARRARTRADAAARAKSEFLANMSHEIRTPLNGVIGLADALSHTDLQPRQQEMLGMILASGRALNGLLSDALDLARADSGGLKLTSEPFDLRESIVAATYLFEPLARDKGVDFDVRFDLRHSGAAVGDALRIRQIVSNLTSNAVKFTDHGEVVVEASLARIDPAVGRLQVTVRDTGQGFDEEVRTRLFSRFEQGDGAVTRKFGGTGLGLAISRRLASMMGGAIDCQSAPGKGSTFSFEMILPLDEAPCAPPAPPQVQPTASGARPRVLLAEDHPVNQKVIEALLGEAVELTVVEDGQAALEALAAEDFDVVLMDIHMPRMDGLTAIQAIRAGEAGASRTPIVSLTADAMPHQVQAALLAGADLHLAKPVTAETLFGAVSQALELAGRPEPARPDAGLTPKASAA